MPIRKLMHLAAVLAGAAAPLAAACGPDDGGSRSRASYDTYTSRLVQLSADLSGDLRLDQWTYMDGNRPIRGEADTDGDGRIDRWEYFDERAGLVRVGASSRNDGIEDTWVWPGPPGGERVVAWSLGRDRFIDRREYFQGDALVRVEDDTNADGRADKWERHEGGVLREVAVDLTLAGGRPNRRLHYDAQGRFEWIEADADGDGRFDRMATPAAGEIEKMVGAGAKR